MEKICFYELILLMSVTGEPALHKNGHGRVHSNLTERSAQTSILEYFATTLFQSPNTPDPTWLCVNYS